MPPELRVKGLGSERSDSGVASLPLTMILREAWVGKSLPRIYMNHCIASRVELSGVVLDLGSGERPSYRRFLTKPRSYITLDIDGGARPTIVASLEQTLPLRDRSVDCVMLFNVLEHVFHHGALVQDVYRVLREEGRCYCSVPFMVPVHADPFDFFRYTASALALIFGSAGFTGVKVTVFGGYGAVLVEHLARVLRLRVLRVAGAIAGVAFDSILRRVIGENKNQVRYALGYFVECRKSMSGASRGG